MGQCLSRPSGLGGGGGGGASANVKSAEDLVSRRENNQTEVDEVLSGSRLVTERYGNDVVVEQFHVSTMDGRDAASVIGYYDGSNIGINKNFFNAQGLNDAYDRCVASGFHPSRGNKTGTEAVVLHEYGHALTAVAASRMQVNGRTATFDEAAKRIVQDAKGAAGHRSAVTLARAISGYASHNYAETIAEAFADVMCNGNRAKRESRAVVSSMDTHLPKK